MPQLHALYTNVHIWQAPELKQLDVQLEANGIKMHPLSWKDYDVLDDDRDHFTWYGFTRFATDLARLVKTWRGRTLVVSDSTIDYWNYNDAGERNSAANAYLESLHPAMLIDAACGSGFEATRANLTDFRTRLLRHPVNRYDHILFVGGWNDIHVDQDLLKSAVKRVVASIRSNQRLR